MRPPHRGLLRLLVLHSLLLGWCALAFVSVRPSAQQQQQQHQQQQQQQHHHHHQQAAAKVYNDDYAWEAQWWPVAFERVTDKTKPHAFELLGKPLVYWWNPVGKQWQATVDTCPHRLAPLSEGRVDGAGCIECPYHGWSFEGSKGTCTKLPQLEAGDVPPQSRDAAAVAAFPTTVEQGIIWVFPTPIKDLNYQFPDKSILALCEPLLDPSIVCLDVSRDLPYSYETLMENILDPSHVPFTHHRTIGRRDNATPIPLRLTSDLTEHGFTGKFERQVATSPMLQRNLNRTRRETVFAAPTYMHHLIETPELATWTVTYATPSAPGKSRILARFPFRFNDTRPASLGSRLRRALFARVPDWMQHLQQNTVLDDDNIFLAVQERRLAQAGGVWEQSYYLPTKGDLYIATFRRWLSKFASGGPFGPPKPEQFEPYDWRQPELLLDRYAQHTKHCASCSKALETCRRWRPRLFGAGIFAATLGKAMLDLVLPGKASLALAAVVSVLLALSWKLMVGLEEALIQGPYPPPRNQPEPKKK